MERLLEKSQKEIAICSECGWENSGSAKFCSQCGDFLGKTVPEQKEDPPLPSAWKKRYRIIKKLDGKERMCAYKVYDMTFDRIAILKYLPEKVKNSSESLQAIVKIEHPNIVRTYDTAMTTQGIYLVHEEFPGTVFKDYIDEWQGLSTKETLHIFYKLCEAVSYLQKNDVVQGDVRYSDIFLDEHDDPKIFNIEKSLIAFPNAPVKSPRDDLPSLGNILYKMLTAEPLPDENREKKLEELPDGLGLVAAKCLQKQYRSAEEILEELQEIERLRFKRQENEKRQFRTLVKKSDALGRQEKYDEAAAILQSLQQGACGQASHELEEMIDKNLLLGGIVKCLKKASGQIEKKCFKEAQIVLEKIPVMCELWEIPINMREKFEELSNEAKEGDAKNKAEKKSPFLAISIWALAIPAILVPVWLIAGNNEKNNPDVNPDTGGFSQNEEKGKKRKVDFNEWFSELRDDNSSAGKTSNSASNIDQNKKKGSSGLGKYDSQKSETTTHFPVKKTMNIPGFKPLFGGTKKHPHYLHSQTGMRMVLFSPKGRQAFLISKDPLLQEQWEKVMGSNSKTKSPGLPVKNIKKKGLKAFCRKTGLEIATREQLKCVSRSDMLFLNMKKIRCSKKVP